MHVEGQGRQGRGRFVFHASRVPGHAWRADAHGAPLLPARTIAQGLLGTEGGGNTRGAGTGNTEKDNPHSYFNHNPDPT